MSVDNVVHLLPGDTLCVSIVRTSDPDIKEDSPSVGLDRIYREVLLEECCNANREVILEIG